MVNYDSRDCENFDFEIGFRTKKGKKLQIDVNKLVNDDKASVSSKMTYPLGVYDSYETRVQIELIKSSILAFEKTIKNYFTIKESKVKIDIVGAADAVKCRSFNYEGGEKYGKLNTEPFNVMKNKWSMNSKYLAEIEKGTVRLNSNENVSFNTFTRSDHNNLKLAEARAKAFKYYLTQDIGESVLLDTNKNVVTTRGVIHKFYKGSDYRYAKLNMNFVLEPILRKVERKTLPKPCEPDFFFIFIDVNKYDNNQYKSLGCKSFTLQKDSLEIIKTIKDTLIEYYEVQPSDFIELENPTLQQMYEAFSILQDSIRITSKTNVMIVYSGHGGPYYITARDSKVMNTENNENLQEKLDKLRYEKITESDRLKLEEDKRKIERELYRYKLFGWNTLANYFESSKSPHILFVADACHIGGVTNASIKPINTIVNSHKKGGFIPLFDKLTSEEKVNEKMISSKSRTLLSTGSQLSEQMNVCTPFFESFADYLAFKAKNTEGNKVLLQKDNSYLQTSYQVLYDNGEDLQIEEDSLLGTDEAYKYRNYMECFDEYSTPSLPTFKQFDNIKNSDGGMYWLPKRPFFKAPN